MTPPKDFFLTSIKRQKEYTLAPGCSSSYSQNIIRRVIKLDNGNLASFPSDLSEVNVNQMAKWLHGTVMEVDCTASYTLPHRAGCDKITIGEWVTFPGVVKDNVILMIFYKPTAYEIISGIASLYEGAVEQIVFRAWYDI